MDKAERQQHYATNIDEILTLGARLRCPGQVSPSLPHSKHTLSAPFSSAVGNLSLVTVSLDPLEKRSNVSAIVSCTAGARYAESQSELNCALCSCQQYTCRRALQHPGGKINPEQLSQSILGQEAYFPTMVTLYGEVPVAFYSIPTFLIKKI